MSSGRLFHYKSFIHYALLKYLYHSSWFIAIFSLHCIALNFLSCLVLLCCTVHYCLFSFLIFSLLATSSITQNLTDWQLWASRSKRSFANCDRTRRMDSKLAGSWRPKSSPRRHVSNSAQLIRQTPRRSLVKSSVDNHHQFELDSLGSSKPVETGKSVCDVAERRRPAIDRAAALQWARTAADWVDVVRSGCHVWAAILTVLLPRLAGAVSHSLCPLLSVIWFDPVTFEVIARAACIANAQSLFILSHVVRSGGQWTCVLLLLSYLFLVTLP